MAFPKKSRKYFPSEIETKWQEKWKESGIYRFKPEDGKKPYYNLVELPYPSGDLHLGHWFAFVPPDAHARYHRMKGNNTFFPNGFDAFGLPAENAAIKHGVHPRDWTLSNIETMHKQFSTMGTMIDWGHEVVTCEPEYYHWNQWIFLKLYEKGLAYRGKAFSNWCPSCQTVLANEAIENGTCWRCGSMVEQQEIEQWYLKITDYAERLLWPEEAGPVSLHPPAPSSLASFSAGARRDSSAPVKQASSFAALSPLPALTTRQQVDASTVDWPKSVREGQNNWIGKSEGAEINFELDKKHTIILLHGFEGSSEGNFYPWLKKSLEEKGHTVHLPTLPNTNNPTEDEQVGFVLENFSFDENTILYGHSLGSVVAMKVLEKLNSPIAGLVLSGTFGKPEFLDYERPFADTFMWDFDADSIKKKTGFVRVLHDRNDSAVPRIQAQTIADMLGVELEIVQAQKVHFSATEEPEILTRLVPSVEIFTTRPDTLFGATFLVLAPEHPILASLLSEVEPLDEVQPQQKEKLKSYVKLARQKTEIERKEQKEKTGVFTGLYALHPTTHERIPVWVADYVLWGYGTGAIMAVPGHDQRDYEFAKMFDLPVKQVIKGHPESFGHSERSEESQSKLSKGSVKTDKDSSPRLRRDQNDIVYKGTLVNSKEWNGWQVPGDIAKVIESIEKARIGRKKTTYHLHDWSISRQRYWGTPVPMIHCDRCGIVPVPEKDLPVTLPYEVDYTPKGRPPLATAEEWLSVTCPECKGEAKRDAETLDTFFDSSWYYYRYVSPHYKEGPFDKLRVAKLLPVDIYFGGAEHTLGHTLYARFFTKFFHEIGLIEFDEFASKRVQHGVILGPDGNRMSKSKGNVVNPDDVVSEYGADTVRVYLCFMMPYVDTVAPWNPKAIAGMYRFLKRVWELQEKVSSSRYSRENGNQTTPDRVGDDNHDLSKEDLYHMHKTIKKVGEDLSSIKFNTALSSLMEWLNFLSAKKQISLEEYKTLLLLLAPFAPHMTEELYQFLGNPKSEIRNPSFSSIHLQSWPHYDDMYLQQETVKIAVQVNGKLRDTIDIDRSDLEEQDKVEKQAKASSNVRRHIEGKEIKKVIYIKGKILNVVVQ